MIKANAYGHGLIPVARALAQADAFGVACLEEALILRESGIRNAMVLMAGFFEASELDIITREAFIPVIQNAEQLRIIEAEKLKKPLDVWVKINTGMNRLGFAVTELKTILARVQAIPAVRSVSVLSHFSDADQLQSDKTARQTYLFEQTAANFKGAKSLANSAAILAWPNTHYDWVRPGVMLYGISPFANEVGQHRGLKPVMTLHSRIIALHDIAQGETVGYGSTFTADKAMRIAIVCMGYGDGYPWHAPLGTPILIHGVRCPIIGRVSMDMLAVELKTPANLYDPVLIWGADLPVEEVAAHTGTIPYELVTKLTARVQLKVVNHV